MSFCKTDLFHEFLFLRLIEPVRADGAAPLAPTKSRTFEDY